jgi:hypothetical protein
MRFKKFINEDNNTITYKGVTIKRLPNAENFPVDEIKVVLDTVPKGDCEFILVDNTPAVYTREGYRTWAFYRAKERAVIVSQLATKDSKIRYVIAHELAHANGHTKEKEADKFASKYYKKPKGLP